MAAFQLLPVDGVVLPTTYLGWSQLGDDDLQSVLEVYGNDFLINVVNSALVRAVPSAFTITRVGNASAVPAHELEGLLARFARGDVDS